MSLHTNVYLSWESFLTDRAGGRETLTPNTLGSPRVGTSTPAACARPSIAEVCGVCVCVCLCVPLCVSNTEDLAEANVQVMSYMDSECNLL